MDNMFAPMASEARETFKDEALSGKQGENMVATEFHKLILAIDTGSDFRTMYDATYAAEKEVAGSAGDRRKLEKDGKLDEWAEATGADKLRGNLAVHMSTLTKVVAKIRKRDADKAWDRIGRAQWTKVQKAASEAGTMNQLLRWAQNGGTPAEPKKAKGTPRRTKATKGKGKQMKPANGVSAETTEALNLILDSVETALDKAAREAVQKVLTHHAERLARQAK